MGDDLEIISELPSGCIRFDILKGLGVHDTRGEVDLYIAREMQAWLRDRLAKDNIPDNAIRSATLDVEMDTDRIKTDKKRVVSFDSRCHSRISTDEKTYEVELTDRHVWHSSNQPV